MQKAKIILEGNIAIEIDEDVEINEFKYSDSHENFPDYCSTELFNSSKLVTVKTPSSIYVIPANKIILVEFDN